jgi:hypothetical protein
VIGARNRRRENGGVDVNRSDEVGSAGFVRKILYAKGYIGVVRAEEGEQPLARLLNCLGFRGCLKCSVRQVPQRPHPPLAEHAGVVSMTTVRTPTTVPAASLSGLCEYVK